MAAITGFGVVCLGCGYGLKDAFADAMRKGIYRWVINRDNSEFVYSAIRNQHSEALL